MSLIIALAQALVARNSCVHNHTQHKEEDPGENVIKNWPIAVHIPSLTSVLSPCCILSVNLSCRHTSRLSFDSLSSPQMSIIIHKCYIHCKTGNTILQEALSL